MRPPIHVFLSLLSFAAAQEPPTSSDERIATTAVSRCGGLAATGDDRLLGLGADYQVVFEPAGPVFTPALGERAPHDQPLAFRMVDCGRGERLQNVTATAPEATGSDTVHYPRPGVVERYTVRPDGLKQDFVFSALPPGDGDLLVRGRITTELPVASHDGGLDFVLPGVGGVRLGGVVGIDANGDRVAGSIAFAGGTVEYRLPASFVARAALPLVLDPLLTPLILLGSADNEDAPAIASIHDSLCWLAVWRRIYSATNSDVYGQRIAWSGSLLGPTLGIETVTNTTVGNPRVGAVRASGAFLVTYAAGGDVFARSVGAISGSIGTQTAIVTGSNNQQSPEIGSDVVGGGRRAMIVWRDLTANATYLRTVAPAGSGLALGPVLVVSTAAGEQSFVLSRSGGERGVWMIVWQRSTGTGPGITDIWGQAWTENGALGPAQLLVDETINLSSPAIDGDGYDFVLAYQRATSSTNSDVYARPLEVRGTQIAVGSAVAMAGTTTADELAPSVAWLGQSVLVAWQLEIDPNNHDTHARSIDPYTCLVCEGTTGLGQSSSFEGSVEASSQFAGGRVDGGGGAVVWRRYSVATSTGDVVVARYEDLDGQAIRLATRCGNGGEAVASCARRGNTAFQLRLRHGQFVTFGIVMLAFERADWVCGPCLLVPEPLTGFFAFDFAEPDGSFTIAIPLPTTVSTVPIYVQWGTGVGTGASCLGLELSSGIALSIQ